MKKFLVQLFILFVLFNNVVFNTISFPSFFGYWDEIIELIVIFIGFLTLNKTVQKKYLIISLLLIIMLILALMGNLIFEYVPTMNAIFRDVIGFLKFPIILMILKKINYDDSVNKFIDNKFIRFIKFIIIIIFIGGVISIFKDIGLSQNEIRNGLKPYKFLFSHPTYLVLTSVFLLIFIDSWNYKNDKKGFIYQFMLLIVIALTMRTKGIIIAALYIFIKYAGNWLKRLKFFYWIGTFFVAFFAAYQKLQLYASYASSPREALYKGSILLANKCFPFGSGFASFASHISATSGSKVYEFIDIPYYWVENGNKYAVLGDAGLAYYIGQFGYLGFIIFVIVMFSIYKMTLKDIQNKLPVKIMWLYLIIAITSESILINNGIELCLMLLLICGMNKTNDKINVKGE